MSDRETSDGDRSYYSDSSHSYYSDHSTSSKNTDNKKRPRRAFVFMGDAKALNALKRGSQKNKLPADLLNENKVKIAELRNRNVELLEIVDKLQHENRDVSRMMKRQQVHLNKIHLQEDSMPNLIDRQSNETRALHERIRILKERLGKEERRGRGSEQELDGCQRKLKHLQALVSEKGLKERQDLNNLLNHSNKQLQHKQDSVNNLERHIENMEKNHKHEVGLKKARQLASNQEVQVLRDEVERLHTLLQEKDKESAVANIYSLNHRHKPPHRLPSSIRSTPALVATPHKHLDSLNNNHFDSLNNNHLNNNNNLNNLNKKSPLKKSSANALDHKRTKAPENQTRNRVLKQSNNKVYVKKTPSNNYNNLNNSPTNDVHDVDKKTSELQELEKKINNINKTHLNNNNYTNNNNFTSNNNSNNNNNKSKPSRKATERQKQAMLEKMRKIDDNKYLASATSTSNNNKNNNFTSYNSNNNLTSIIGSSNTYQPSFHNDDQKKAFILPSSNNNNINDLFTDDEDDFLNNNNNSNSSPVFLNLNNNSNNSKHLLPKRAQEDTSLATLNGLESDEEVDSIRKALANV